MENNSYKHSLKVTQTTSRKGLMVFGGADAPAPKQADVLHIALPLNVLASSEGYAEFWGDTTSISAMGENPDGDCRWVHSEDHLGIVFEPINHDLHEMTVAVYRQAYQLANDLGYGYLLRTWNYIDAINAEQDGQERYQTFCVARHEILEQLNQLDLPNPAATAIGGHGGHHQFIFLFSRQAGRVVENQRQVSAWQYPKVYAPKQPRFSRAMQCGNLLLCSGTASVVGHETIHLNDVEAQLDECLVNIQALIEASGMAFVRSRGIYRFYLRDEHLLAAVLSRLQFHDITAFVVYAGDVCRDNLLIECEAVFQKP